MAGMAIRRDPLEEVQRTAFRAAAARPARTLRVDEIRPVVRIAHRRSGPLEIPERVIVDHELVLILDGHGELRFPGESVRYRPHDLLVIEPFVPHRFAAAGTGAARHVAVHFDLAPGVPPTGARLAERRPYAVRFARGARL